jgi:hypothetical protein
LIPPPQWTSAQLEEARLRAIERFRTERLEEPLEEYGEVFDDYQGKVEELLEATVDLGALEEHAVNAFADEKLFEAFRYLAGPPISRDDLKVLAQVRGSDATIRQDPDRVRRLVEVVRIALDRRRFPWVVENRDPSEAERNAAVLASAALIAAQRVATKRRNTGKDLQETLVQTALRERGFARVRSRAIPTLADAPALGEFCGESQVGTRKADIVIRLWDNRVMPIECKVSNSEVNSIKRLNNDAAAKASAWIQDFGRVQIVPAAVLSGVYNLRHLEDAQTRGLALFWAHDLQELLTWIERTRPTP